MPLTVLAMLVLTTAAGAADEEDRVVLHAETQRGTADGWHGEGDVQIIFQDIDLRCDTADWNRATGEVVARGRGADDGIQFRNQDQVAHAIRCELEPFATLAVGINRFDTVVQMPVHGGHLEFVFEVRDGS